MTQTVRLVGPKQRHLAHSLIDKAGDGYVVTVSEPKRTTEQSSRMWAMLSDVARAKPEGRAISPEVWKSLFLASLGHQVMFEPGLDGLGVIPVGFRSSRLTKAQMSAMIDVIGEYGARHGVRWSEPTPQHHP